MSSFSCVTILLGVLLCVHTSLQYVASPTCFGQVCPSGTTNCKEFKKSTSDRSLIDITISCLDDYDGSLKEYHYQEPSNLDRYTSYQNTRFESVNEGISRSPDPSLDLTPHRGYNNEFY